MSFLMSNAWAEGAGAGAAQAAPDMSGFIMLAVLFVLFYVILIRPQAKRAKEHKKMVEALSKGDEVVTNGGLLGLVKEVGETFITVEIASGTQVKIQRNAIATLLPKGTYKSKD